MSKAERDSLITTIEYLAESVAEKHGIAVAESAFSHHGIDNLDTLSVGELWEILGNLQQIESD